MNLIPTFRGCRAARDQSRFHAHCNDQRAWNKDHPAVESGRAAAHASASRRELMRAVSLVVIGFLTLAWQNATPQAPRPPGAGDAPFLTSELLFPLEHWHNHGSMIVELPGGDLLTCWFHGSGERTADDVVILGARLPKGGAQWSKPFVMADTPGYPDTNSTMFVDPRRRLWLLWPTILANEWHTALMKYRISSDYQGDGPPRWETSEVLHVTPGD